MFFGMDPSILIPTPEETDRPYNQRPVEYGPPRPFIGQRGCDACQVRWQGYPGTTCWVCGDPAKHPEIPPSSGHLPEGVAETMVESLIEECQPGVLSGA